MTGIDKISASAQHRAIEKAGKVKNPFEPFASDLAKYTIKTEAADLETQLYCKWKADMDAKTLKWAFKLAERNVSPYYKVSPTGWQPKVKQSDLNKNWARYLVAIDNAKRPIAYTMFRFDMDYGNSVLYCYEMQIEKEYHRHGLGTHMMTALEKMAKLYEMEKLILTVLDNNTDSIEFFRRLGFVTDDSSPDKSEKSGYEILSKKLF